MNLKPNQKRHLRGLAHALKPVVMIGGKGVTPALLDELDQALAHHELVKVQIAGDDRAARAQVAQQLAAHTGAQAVQVIGKTLSLYRRHAQAPKIELPP